MKKDVRRKKILKLSICAMLIGISVVIGTICRYYLTFGMFVRITFENLPIILIGVIFGPIYGMTAGLCTDLISCVASAQEINPLVTLGALTVGLVSGLVSRALKRSKFRILFSCALSHAIGCVLIKTVGLYLYYFSNTVSLWYLLGVRALVYLLICVSECVMITLILNNKYIKGRISYELQ